MDLKKRLYVHTYIKSNEVMAVFFATNPFIIDMVLKISDCCLFQPPFPVSTLSTALFQLSVN